MDESIFGAIQKLAQAAEFGAAQTILEECPELLQEGIVEALEEVASETEGNKRQDSVAIQSLAQLLRRCLVVGAPLAFQEVAAAGVVWHKLEVAKERDSRGFWANLANKVARAVRIWQPDPAALSFWEDTSYPAVFQLAQKSSIRHDRFHLKTVEEKAFEEARNAHQSRRPRTAIQHLFTALAYNVLAGSLTEAATCVGNLAMEFSEISDFRKALRLQHLAVSLKQKYRNEPEALARSWRQIADAHLYLGNYAIACEYIAKALELSRREDGWHDLNRELKGYRKWLQICIRFSQALAATIEDAAFTRSPSTLRNIPAEQIDTFRSALDHAEAIGSAKRRKALQDELKARLELGDLLFGAPIRMYADSYCQFRAARDLARSLSNLAAEGTALLGEARAAMEMGAFDRAREALERAISAFRSNPPSDTKCKILFDLSLISVNLGQSRKADQYLSTALTMASDLPVPHIAVELLCAEGSRFLRQDLAPEAMRCFGVGTEIVKRSGLVSKTVAQLYYEIGHVFYTLGQWPEAVAALEQSLRYAEAINDSEAIAFAQVRLAECHAASSNVEEALDLVKEIDRNQATANAHLSEAIGGAVDKLTPHMFAQLSGADLPKKDAAYEASGSFSNWLLIEQLQAKIEAGHDDSPVSPFLHCLLASELDKQGESKEAAHHFLIGLRLARKQGVVKARGYLLHDFGVLRARTGRIASARRAFAAALASKDKYTNGKGRWSSLVSLAKANLYLSRKDDFDRLLTEIENKLGDSTDEEPGSTRLLLCEIYHLLGRLHDAKKLIPSAVEMLSGKGYRDDFLQSFAVAVLVHLDANDIDGAEQWGRRGLKEIEATRSQTVEEYRNILHRFAVPIVNGLLEVHLSRHDPLGGLQVLEHVKARSVIEHFSQSVLASPPGFPSDLKRIEAELLGSVTGAKLVLENCHEQWLRPDWIRAADEANKKLRDFWNDLPPKWQPYAKLRNGEPVEAAKILASKTATAPAHFLIIHPTDKRTFVWHFGNDGALRSWNSIPLNRLTLEDEVSQALAAISKRDPIKQSLSVIEEALAPHFRSVAEGETVCIIPGGPLLQLPFAAVRIDGHFLIERNPLIMLPCISVLSYWDFDRTYRDFAQPLVLGDSLSDLPNAREEARHVAATLRAIPLLGREVLRSNLQLRLSGCDLLHVACHASYNEIQPELSGFYLSDESMVSARDLREMRLRTRLVVLSACESGRAHVDLGDETTGLAASLLYAGAHSVISTLWKVPDEETKTLMLDLYAHFLDLKVPVAVALAQAQCHMLKSPRNHPYYWAAFQFWGQWDIAFSKNHESGAQTQSAKRRRSADRSTPRLSARGRTS